MAKDLKGKELPKGIVQRETGLYVGYFVHEGKKLTVSSMKLTECKRKLEDRRYEITHGALSYQSTMKVDDWF